MIKRCVCKDCLINFKWEAPSGQPPIRCPKCNRKTHLKQMRNCQRRRRLCPEVREHERKRQHAYSKRPDVRAHRQKREQYPEVKEKRRKYYLKHRQLKKEAVTND